MHSATHIVAVVVVVAVVRVWVETWHGAVVAGGGRGTGGGGRGRGGSVRGQAGVLWKGWDDYLELQEL